MIDPWLLIAAITAINLVIMLGTIRAATRVENARVAAQAAAVRASEYAQHAAGSRTTLTMTGGGQSPTTLRDVLHSASASFEITDPDPWLVELLTGQDLPPIEPGWRDDDRTES